MIIASTCLSTNTGTTVPSLKDAVAANVMRDPFRLQWFAARPREGKEGKSYGIKTDISFTAPASNL